MSHTAFKNISEGISTAIIDSRYTSENNFVGRVIDGYDSPDLFLTVDALTALKSVADDVAELGLRLLIFDAYRPQRAVDDFMAWSRDESDQKMKADYYPNINKATLFEQGFLIEQSSHSRGSTVDLTLADIEGKPLPMGTNFDFFGPEAHHGYEGITPLEAKNRITLAKAMIKAGFAPYPPEWWHFTLKHEPYPDTYFDYTMKELLT